MKKKVPLATWLSKPGRNQQMLADAVGLTQGAISHMLNEHIRKGTRPRNVWVCEQDGRVWLEEIKTIGNVA